jgi:hypothetical protein
MSAIWSIGRDKARRCERTKEEGREGRRAHQNCRTMGIHMLVLQRTSPLPRATLRRTKGCVMFSSRGHDSSSTTPFRKKEEKLTLSRESETIVRVTHEAQSKRRRVSDRFVKAREGRQRCVERKADGDGSVLSIERRRGCVYSVYLRLLSF